jgi:hypothetical protein
MGFKCLAQGGFGCIKAHIADVHVLAHCDFLFLQAHDVHGLWTLGALFDGEFDALALLEALVAITPDASVMDKDVVPTFSSYETIALGVIEPLDGPSFSIAHCLVSFL